MIVFCHCRIGEGWWLSVLRDLVAYYEWGQKVIFTLYSDRDFLDVEGEEIPIVTALPWWLNRRLVGGSRWFRWLRDPRNLMPLYPLLTWILSHKVARLIKKHPHPHSQRVVVSSFAVAKNIVLPGHVDATLYLHSPNQYLWSHYKEYRTKLRGYKKLFFILVVPYLRLWDSYISRRQRFDTVIYNSKYTKKSAHEVYGSLTKKDWQEKIVYPRIHDVFVHGSVAKNYDDYFIFVWRTVRFVRELDKILAIFAERDEHLLIVGDGPDKHYLMAKAPDNVTRCGHIGDVRQKYDLIRKSRGMINLSYESFGIATCEALLVGVPVLGYAKWWTKELVSPESGVLVDDKRHETLLVWFDRFCERVWKREKIRDAIVTTLSERMMSGG